MGHAAGELADRLHLLRLQQLGLQLLALLLRPLARGDVGEDAGELVGRGAEGGHLELIAGLVAQAKFSTAPPM